MSKTRKILSLLVAVVMVFGVFSVCAFAADEYIPTDKKSDGSYYTQVWSLSEPVDNNDGTWSVNVNLKTNYGVGGIQFKLDITGNATLTNVEKGANLPDYYDAVQKTTDKVMLVPLSGTGSTKDSSEINGAIVKLTFKVDGAATVGIKKDPKGTTGASVGGSLIAVRTSNLAGQDQIVGQQVTVGEAKSMGKASTPPTLGVIDGTGGVIDTTRTEHISEDGTEYEVTGLIYGVEVCDVEDEDGNATDAQTIEDVFEVVGDGSLNIVENEAGSECGTGTKVEVLDGNGEVVETYILVIFGDLDGDGEITSLDATLAETHEILVYDEDDGEITDTVILFAADVDGDEEVTSLDATLMSTHELLIYDEVDGCMSQAEVIAILTENDII